MVSDICYMFYLHLLLYRCDCNKLIISTYLYRRVHQLLCISKLSQQVTIFVV